MIRVHSGARFRITVAAMALAVVALSGTATLVVATPAAAVPVGCGDDFYLATANTVTQRAADGTATPTSTAPLDPWTLALDPTDGNLYAFPNAAPTGNRVFRIEADGTSTDLGAVTGLPAALYSLGGFDDAGTLWTSNLGVLYAIDLDTMTATSVALSATVLADFAFIDGSLYAATGSAIAPNLARVDRVTGAVTAIPVPGMTSVTSIFTVGGHLYVSQGTAIVEVLGYDTATPTRLTVATGLPSVPRDGASCPTGPSPFLNADDDDYSSTPFTPSTGGSAGTVFGNDTRLGAAVIAADVTVALLDDGGLTGATIGADGILTVPTGASVGTYALVYQICATATPTLCDTAIATLSIVADQAPPPPPSGGSSAAALPPTGLDLGGILAAGAALLVAGMILVRRSKALPLVE